MADAVHLDGAQGEGGGQILRTAAGLAAALGIDVTIENIRSRRSKPGLRAQHLAAVRAAAEICGGRLEGDEIGSRHLTLRPGQLRAGEYEFSIPTAGSTALVCQTVLPALLVADGDSRVVVTGGTHNPMAPCFEYLRDVFGVLAAAANCETFFELERASFHPAGGGRLVMSLRGVGSGENLEPLAFTRRGALRYVEGLSAVGGGLGDRIAERQAAQALSRLAAAGYKATIEQTAYEADSPGTVLFLRAVHDSACGGAFALGRRGYRAENLADDAVDELSAYLDSAGAVDARAADQLLTLAALCPDRSDLLAERRTGHLTTNAAVVEQLTGRSVVLEDTPEGAVHVQVRPA